MKISLSTFIRSTGATLGIVAAMGITTHADPIITEYQSSTAFNAAISGTISTDNLESPGSSLANSQGTNYYSVYAGYLANQTPYATAIGTVTTFNNLYYAGSPSRAFGAGDGSFFLDSSGDLTLHLNAGLVAAGSDVFNAFNQEATSVTVTEGINGGDLFSQTFTITPNIPSTDPAQLIFEGFVATSGYTLVSISYNSPNQYVGVDNLIGATAVSVPEPSTYALLGAGLVALTVAVRRRKSAGV